MSTSDERELAAAFEELSAPASTANYATRQPAQEIRTSTVRWPQLLASALAVVVAVAAAGTFLALRTARQGGTPSSSAGAPPARAGAAMAYDSTSGLTVMFGGTDGTGHALTDTWTWNGSAWTGVSRGPGALVDARMSDDPADAGVMLVGAPAPAPNPDGAVGSGCSVSGSVSPGSIPHSGPAPRVTGSVPVGVAPPAVTASSNPTPACPPTTGPPSVQTWLFTAAGWHRVGGQVSPPPGLQLAFDPTTHQVVGVAPGAFSCGPPLGTPVGTGASIACPLIGSGLKFPAGASAPCGPLRCLNTGAITTWTWSGGSWQEARADATTLDRSGVAMVFTDPATRHATLMSQQGLAINGAASTCPETASCARPPAPVITIWTWSGSGWKPVAQLDFQDGPTVAGAAVAPVEGRLVVLTATGETWTWAAGHWNQNTGANHSHPAMRFGAAMAEGPSGTVVLFGGQASGGFVVTSPGGSSLGSDTWTWNGSAWKHVGGRAPLPPATPSCPAAKSGAGLPCVQPMPAQAPPGSPVSPLASP